MEIRVNILGKVAYKQGASRDDKAKAELYPSGEGVYAVMDGDDFVCLRVVSSKAPDIDYGGVTYSDAVRKSDRRRGVLVSFPCQKVMSMNYCCHEASHVCDAIEEYTDLEHGGEPSAYLMGWIASCINNARLGIGDFVELKDKEK